MDKRVWLTFTTLAVLASLVLGARIMRVFSQGPTVNFKDVSFEIETDSWEFFDANTGKLYVYSKVDGRLRNMWQMNKLGAPIQRLSSFGERYKD